MIVYIDTNNLHTMTFLVISCSLLLLERFFVIMFLTSSECKTRMCDHSNQIGTDFLLLYSYHQHMIVYEEELLQFNLGTMRWNWSEEAIKQKFATDNVTSLVISKLKRFDPDAQNSAKV